MGLQGKITRWDDDKGFGFITGHGDGSMVFVHIKAFSRTSRRPELGDIVNYEIVQGKNGKPSAEKVRFADQALPKKPSSGKVCRFLCVFPLCRCVLQSNILAGSGDLLCA